MLLSLLSNAAVSSLQCCCLFSPLLLSLLSNPRQQHWTEETAALDRRDSSIGQNRQQHWTEETAALNR
jgi:hypothetical protein